MAQRRMFSPDIVNSDAFLEMPPSTQGLYFQLGMKADDDGFVNPKMVMRMIGSSDDELKVLIGKRFVLPFENGVIVIKHWRINNRVRKDWYRPTMYAEQKALLFVKNNGGYTFDEKQGKPLLLGVSVPKSHRIGDVGKDSIGKDSNTNTNTGTRKRVRVKKTIEFNPLGAEILKAFEEVDTKNKTYYGNKTQRAAADFLIQEHGLDQVTKVIKLLPKTNSISYFPTVTSPYDLKEKWGKLEAAMVRKKGESISKGRGVETN